MIREKDDKEISNVIGPHGIDNRNQKGAWALQWLSMMQLRAINTFFKHKDYTTHTSFLPPKLPQMLDVWSISITAFKRVRNSRVYKWGNPSNHAAIELQSALSPIKVNGESKFSKVQTNWDKIK